MVKRVIPMAAIAAASVGVGVPPWFAGVGLLVGSAIANLHVRSAIAVWTRSLSTSGLRIVVGKTIAGITDRFEVHIDPRETGLPFEVKAHGWPKGLRAERADPKADALDPIDAMIDFSVADPLLRAAIYTTRGRRLLHDVVVKGGATLTAAGFKSSLEATGWPDFKKLIELGELFAMDRKDALANVITRVRTERGPQRAEALLALIRHNRRAKKTQAMLKLVLESTDGAARRAFAQLTQAPDLLEAVVTDSRLSDHDRAGALGDLLALPKRADPAAIIQIAMDAGAPELTQIGVMAWLALQMIPDQPRAGREALATCGLQRPPAILEDQLANRAEAVGIARLSVLLRATSRVSIWAAECLVMLGDHSCLPAFDRAVQHRRNPVHRATLEACRDQLRQDLRNRIGGGLTIAASGQQGGLSLEP